MVTAATNIVLVLALAMWGCSSKIEVSTKAGPTPGQNNKPVTDPRKRDGAIQAVAAKLTDPNCVDPELNLLPDNIVMMMCDGSIVRGQMKTLPECMADGQSDCVLKGSQYHAISYAPL